MNRVSVFATLLVFLAGTAAAGPNAGGMLLIHTNPSLNYTFGISYGGQAGLSRAGDAVMSLPIGAAGVCFVMAVFPDSASPRVSGVTFGIEYSPQVEIYESDLSFGDFELVGENWPASGTGTALTANEPVRSTHLLELYWFAAKVDSGGEPGRITVTPHPDHGGFFADDRIPSELDAIVGYGALGFGEPGVFPTPPPAPSVGTGLSISPNPMSSAARIRLEGIAFHPSEIRITDVTGRLVRLLPLGDERTVVWDRKDGRGTSVEAGVYFISAEDVPSSRLVVVQ